MAGLLLNRPRADILAGRLERPAGRSNRTPKRPRVQLLDASGNPIQRPRRGKRVPFVQVIERVPLIDLRRQAGHGGRQHSFAGAVRASQQIEVAGAPVPADQVLAINWSTTTTALDGGTGNALKDLGKSLPVDSITGDFTGGGGAVQSAQVLSVISASGLGFPLGMTNVLKVRRPAGVNSYGFCRIGYNGTTLTPRWPTLTSTGDANYWRVYLKVNVADNQGNIGPGSPCNGISGGTCSHHPIQFPHDSGNFEPTNWFSQNNGMMDLEAYTFANGDGQNAGELAKAVLGTYDGAPYGSQLPKFTVLRFEWMFRKDASNYSIHIRIYDATNEAAGGDGTLMWSEDGSGASQGTVMTEIGAGSQHSLASRNGLYNVGLTAIRSMSIGEEGGYYGYSTDQDFEWGGLAMRTGGWNGKFKPAEQVF